MIPKKIKEIIKDVFELNDKFKTENMPTLEDNDKKLLGGKMKKNNQQKNQLKEGDIPIPADKQIESNYLKDKDKLTLTGKQLREFKKFNIKEGRKQALEEELKFLEGLEKSNDVFTDIDNQLLQIKKEIFIN